MESEERKISVWVCREEKLVLGLSKRTTCTDVVQVLLEDQNSQDGLSVSHSYCIVEKWRGFERVLPNNTKIFRLWVAWAEEQNNVKFVLVKSEASLETHGARSAEARVVLSKQNPDVTKEGPWSPMGVVSPEKHRRVVRRAFRKLERIKKKKKARAAHRDGSCAERMETLIHLVVSQDHTIRQQFHRVTELDAEIGLFESRMHSDRIKRHGVNYVQNTYLVGVEGEAHNCANFSVLVRQCEEVLRLQEKLLEHEDLIESMTEQIQEELNHRWMERTARQGAASPENPQLVETERVRTQLDASLYIGLRLNTDLEAIRSDLELTLQICGAREQEMRDLVEKLNCMAVVGGQGSSLADVSLGGGDSWVGKSERAEQGGGLPAEQGGNDEDSDTGLSSLHSQDSDFLSVWESRV